MRVNVVSKHGGQGSTQFADQLNIFDVALGPDRSTFHFRVDQHLATARIDQIRAKPVFTRGQLDNGVDVLILEAVADDISFAFRSFSLALNCS